MVTTTHQKHLIQSFSAVFCEEGRLTPAEELAQDLLYLSWSDEDDSPGKCIPYFTPCWRTRGVPAEMEEWGEEKDVEPVLPVPRSCGRRPVRGLTCRPDPGSRRGNLPGPRPHPGRGGCGWGIWSV